MNLKILADIIVGKTSRIGRDKIFPWWAFGNMHRPRNHNRHYISDNAIEWNVAEDKILPHYDHIEMSGFYASAIVSYGATKSKKIKTFKHVVFPMLRTVPDVTESSLSFNFEHTYIELNGSQCELVEKVKFNGNLIIESIIAGKSVCREFIVARESACLIEKITAQDKFRIVTPNICVYSQKGVGGGRYKIFSHTVDGSDNGQYVKYVIYSACNESEQLSVDIDKEIEARSEFINDIRNNKLVLSTGNDIVDNMFSFAKLRASESIFRTKGGLMHSPGGGNYYAALWCNDQCEYVNPMFSYLGYDSAKEQLINCFKHFAKYISVDKAVYSSIIAQGDTYWNGAGDRGDNAMYCYGLTRCLLALGDKELFKEFQNTLEDSFAYIRSQKNSEGVIQSDSDELENRFLSGNANLSTSCLAYDAMLSMCYIYEDLGEADKALSYRDEADQLAKSIELYFGDEIEGYHTYRYCKQEDKLRSWICLPIVMGILDRKDGTLSALKCKKLLCNGGYLSRTGCKTFWDRSSLYTFRGIANCGDSQLATKLINDYSQTRLLGEHIPYAVEAYPEGNQAHLSAESGLYVRVLTEGILGIRPVGFSKFEMKINMLADSQQIVLNKLNYSGKDIDIVVTKTTSGLNVCVNNGDKNTEFNTQENTLFVYDIKRGECCLKLLESN